MKIAVVELQVDLRETSAPEVSGAVREAIVADRERKFRILDAIRAARAEGASLCVFPGWTVAANSPPAWLVRETVGISVLFECCPPNADDAVGKGPSRAGGSSTTYLVRNGAIVLGPIRQVAATAAQLRYPPLLSKLTTELRDGRRIPTDVEGGDWLVLVCGESNIVSGLGSGCRLDENVGLTPEDVQLRLVLNPAHTPGGPQAMRDKRSWLARQGTTVTTANTFVGARGWRGAHRAAKAWQHGAPADDRMRLASETDGMKLFVLAA